MNTTEKITIYYFSATGNSLKAASDIASLYTQSELVKISRKATPQHPDSTSVGFVFPVYMGGVPDIVIDFLKGFPFRKDTYYFSIATYYTYKGSAISVVNKILNDKGFALSYGNYIPTVGNCLKEYEVPASKRPSILKKADAITTDIANEIKAKIEKQPSPYCRLSDKIHKGLFNIFFKDTHKKFTLENNCTGCGMCSKVCPVDNISITDKKPVWGVNCESCHACVHWCPGNAINLGKSKGRLQYNNPDIKAGSLF
ncbi:EFR1 family ferrodoxin [Dysgonomonas macrotermitis]|uniref:4Fe-4S dicluster domain-containing protein n=1 Tax=Dysgonomonas macrotermitis TaxID=1346286 RepID=A0A1M4W1C7_9BACT|nr:EFR1 family ferrodoxin [Dysgonomonas macrotermitis]SHE75061.1 4Fe-4S dicluster domain-containing protein [Dysgonomonas macrotermitis]